MTHTITHDPPMDRLAVEKEILRTESKGRPLSVTERIAPWRYGAQGYGVLGYPEWGLAEITADDVRAWVARWYTRENAVVWFRGMAVPENLRLDLPSGARMPLPELTSPLPRTPAWVPGPPEKIGFHTHVPRAAAAQVFTNVLEQELFRALRQEGGYSYAVGTNYEPIHTEWAAVVALADAHPDKQEAALHAFIDVLARLRRDAVDETVLDRVRALAEKNLSDPDIEADRLPAVAAELDYASAAQALGVPIGTVRSRLARARRKLMRLRGEPDPQPGQVHSGRPIVASRPNPEAVHD